MSIPLRWAPGDRALIEVTVIEELDSDGEHRIALYGARPWRAWAPPSELRIPPLVADDTRVVELVAAARGMLVSDSVSREAEDRLRRALALIDAALAPSLREAE